MMLQNCGALQHDEALFVAANSMLYLSREGIIVTKANFLHRNGVILVDNGNGVICQQLLKGATGVQVWAPVTQVVKGEQDLCTCLQTPMEQIGIILAWWHTTEQEQQLLSGRMVCMSSICSGKQEWDHKQGITGKGSQARLYDSSSPGPELGRTPDNSA